MSATLSKLQTFVLATFVALTTLSTLYFAGYVAPIVGDSLMSFVEYADNAVQETAVSKYFSPDMCPNPNSGVTNIFTSEVPEFVATTAEKTIDAACPATTAANFTSFAETTELGYPNF